MVIAAPGSGHGKTTVATGLLAALRERGLAVSGHKIGPDYIDPGYHALATGRPGRNLDPVLCGPDLIVPLLRPRRGGADIAIVEGVMGLFDGRGHTRRGSTAHVAQLVGAPVLLVVDAAGLGRSVAALVAGFAGSTRAAAGGVLLNRVGLDRHEDILRAALAGIGVPVLGALRRDDQVAVPVRHLGLIAGRGTAARGPGGGPPGWRPGQPVGRPRSRCVALAQTATPLSVPAWSPSFVIVRGWAT